MPTVAIVFGLALVALGVWGYVTSDAASVTALIPAFFGAPLTLCGILAQKEAFLKHAMHAAAMLGLIGFLGSAMGLARLPALLSGGDVARPKAVIVQSIMAVLMAIFVGLCIKSFRDARRQRAQQG